MSELSKLGKPGDWVFLPAKLGYYTLSACFEQHRMCCMDYPLAHVFKGLVPPEEFALFAGVQEKQNAYSAQRWPLEIVDLTGAVKLPFTFRGEVTCK